MTTPAMADALHRALGTRIPMLGAPMAHISGGRLAMAVSAAGGLGFLGGGYGDLEWIEAQLAAADPARIGIGLITWTLPSRPEVLEAVLAHRPRAVWLSFGDPRPHIPAVRAAGIAVVCQVTDVAEAVQAHEAGADVLVVQGSEAGGHGREGRGLLSLLPAVAEQVTDIPLVAAGGIATGRQIAACWHLGATGVALGTRLYATAEALDTDAAKRQLTVLRGDETVRTTVIDLARGPRWPAGYTGRAARNAFVDRWHTDLPGLVADLSAQQQRYRAGVAADDLSTRVLWAGEALDLIEAVEPAGPLVERLHDDALARYPAGG